MSLSDELKKIFAGPKARASEAGQAVLEYILVLVVSVSIILGALYQFNDAFKNLLDNYFGDYLACLLETGELPGLGGGGGPTQAECNAGFQNFSLASGRPSKTPNESSSSGGSEGSDDDSSSSGGRPASFTNNNSPLNSEAGAGGFGSGSNNRPARQRLNAARNTRGNPEATEASEDSAGGVVRKRRIVRRRRKLRVSEDFLPKKKKNKTPKVTIAKKPKKEAVLAALRTAKFRFKPPEPPAPKTPDPTFDLSFGKMLKILIILGILVAIFIFLGGQAMQIKKSWQKAE